MKAALAWPLPFVLLIGMGACTGIVDNGISDRSGGSAAGDGEGHSGGLPDAARGTGGSASTPGSSEPGGAAGDPGTGSGGGGPVTGTGGSNGQAEGGNPTGSGGAMGSGGAVGPGPTSGTGGAVGTGGTTQLDGSAAGSGGATRPDAGGAGATGAGRIDGGATTSDAASVTPGLGAWTTGYVATMYGNATSGDCAGYPSFSDATPIRTGTCSRVVTVATFAAGVANNASYYGATGDLSSLWAGATCTCGGGDTCTGTQVPSCPAEQQAGGNCGICVAVKCDPAGTFSLGNTTHNQDCDRTQFAVVQIIDACPHNHPTNLASSEGWCTTRQPNHIDLSCSALGGISTRGMNVGQDGWLNVDVQQVDCGIGLGLHPL